MSSEAQRKAYKTYNKKKKTFSAVYTPSDMIEGLRLEQYLKGQTISANAYIKSLIKADLDGKGIPYPDSQDEV